MLSSQSHPADLFLRQFFFFLMKYVFQAGQEIKKQADRVCFQVTLQELLDLFLFLNKTENKNKSAFAI